MAEEVKSTGGNAQEEAEKEITIEEGLRQLDGLLEKLKEEELPIEESFALYEQGIKLVREVTGRIDRVEKKVQLLSESGQTEDWED